MVRAGLEVQGLSATHRQTYKTIEPVAALQPPRRPAALQSANGLFGRRRATTATAPTPAVPEGRPG